MEDVVSGAESIAAPCLLVLVVTCLPLCLWGWGFCLFHVLDFWLWNMWDPISPARDQTCTPCIGRWRVNHWTARKSLDASVLDSETGNGRIQFLEKEGLSNIKLKVDFFLAMPYGMWDLSSLTRDWTCTPLPWKPRGLTIGQPGKSQRQKTFWIFLQSCFSFILILLEGYWCHKT